MLGDLQGKKKGMATFDNLAPAASPLARLGRSDSPRDLSLLGGRASRRDNIPPFGTEFASVRPSVSPSLAETVSGVENSDKISRREGNERSPVSPLIDRSKPWRKKPEKAPSGDEQEDDENPYDVFPDTSDSGYEIESEHGNGLTHSGKRSRARKRDIYSCGYHSCSQKFSRKSSYDRHLQHHPTHAPFAFTKYSTEYLTRQRRKGHDRTLDMGYRSGRLGGGSTPQIPNAIMTTLPSEASDQEPPDAGAANPRIPYPDGRDRYFTTHTLFISNLAVDADEHSLRSFFESYGFNLLVIVPTDSKTGKPKGFGYVRFTSIVKAAVAFGEASGRYLKGRQLHLEFSPDFSPPRMQQPLEIESSESSLSSPSTEGDEPTPSHDDVRKAFIKIRSIPDDKRVSLQCIYCNHIMSKKHPSRRRQHLLECDPYQREQRALRDVLVRRDRQDLTLVFEGMKVHPEPASHIFMHYTISEDRCGDNDALRGSILARLGIRRETQRC